jgi:hypothetical protein
MRPGLLRLPLLILAVVGALAAAVALIAAGTGLVARPAGCAATVAPGGETAAGISLSAGQVANARIIYAVGVVLGLPERAEVIALATAMQESELQNLPYGTGDSLGLFQQQPSDGWGTAAQVMDPVTSSRSFYLALMKVSGWQRLPLTVAAQAVQRSAFPMAYARWQGLATQLSGSFAGAAAPSEAECGHLAIGDGLIVQAPETGENVQLSSLSSWIPAIVAVGRIV